MNDPTRIEQRFRLVNPVPDPSAPPMSAETAATTLFVLDERNVTMQTTTSTKPTHKGPKRPWLIVIAAAATVVLVGVGLLAMLRAADDSPDVANGGQAGVFATSIDDIAGRWRASGFPWYLELVADGTHQFGVDSTRLEENLAGRPDGTYRFQSNLVYIESSQCTTRGIAEPGVYRIRFVATPDVIQFEPVEETCRERRTFFAVDSDTLESITWTRVEG